MLICMRTTLNLDDALVSKARLVAVTRRLTLTALIEEGLRIALLHYAEPRGPVVLPTVDGGWFPEGFPFESGSAMIEFLEGPGAPP